MSSPTCPNCHKPATRISSTIHNGAIQTSCEHCRNLVQPHALAAKNRREQQKKDFRGDILQPTDKRAYARKYTAQAREMWGDDETRRLL